MKEGPALAKHNKNYFNGNIKGAPEYCKSKLSRLRPFEFSFRLAINFIKAILCDLVSCVFWSGTPKSLLITYRLFGNYFYQLNNSKQLTLTIIFLLPSFLFIFLLNFFDLQRGFYDKKAYFL